MKRSNLLLVAGLGLLIMSCKKEECHECHYENASGAEVELGERCGDDLENLEASGYSDGSTVYEVHCHEH